MNLSSRWGSPTNFPVHNYHQDRLNEGAFTEAWSIFKKDGGCSFTHFISFIVLKRYGVTHVFTFDKHFRDVGFQPIP